MIIKADDNNDENHVCMEPGCRKAFRYASKLQKLENFHVQLETVEAFCGEPGCKKFFTNKQCLTAHLQTCHQNSNLRQHVKAAHLQENHLYAAFPTDVRRDSKEIIREVSKAHNAVKATSGGILDRAIEADGDLSRLEDNDVHVNIGPNPDLPRVLTATLGATLAKHQGQVLFVIDIEFGKLQARNMLEHLWTRPISNASVESAQGGRSVEVRANGVTKV
ncbi:transcription factor IIIA [Tanacetum coccineum]